MNDIFKIKLKIKDLPTYKTTKYKYKSVREIIEGIFLDFDFMINSNLNLKIKKISNSRFIIDSYLSEYFISFKIFINEKNEVIFKTTKLNIEQTINKSELHLLMYEEEFKRVSSIIKDPTLTIEQFINNKSFYASISDICQY